MRHRKSAKRWAAALLSLALALGLGGCQLFPSDDYNDYDVSAYIQAFLDSSYHNSHERFLALSQSSSQEEALLNNTTTVENAAVNFCNAYGLSPNEEQLTELQGIMGQALASAQYTVMDERRIDTGYYIEVEVTPVTSLAGLTPRPTAPPRPQRTAKRMGTSGGTSTAKRSPPPRQRPRRSLS